MSRSERGKPKKTRPADPTFAERIGEEIWIKFGWQGLYVPVRIIDARVTYGRTCFDVVPVVGLGDGSVNADRALTQAQVREMLRKPGTPVTPPVEIQ